MKKQSIFQCYRNIRGKCDDVVDSLGAGNGVPCPTSDHQAPGEQVPPAAVHREQQLHQQQGGGLRQPWIPGGGVEEVAVAASIYFGCGQ